MSPRKDYDGNLIGYRMQIRGRGHPPQVRTFRQKSEAMIWSRSIEGEMDKGLFVDFSEAERTTLDELFDRYRSDVTPAKRGAAAELSKIAVIKRHPTCGDRSPALRGLILRSIATISCARYRLQRSTAN